MTNRVRLVWEGKRTTEEALTLPTLRCSEQYGEAPESAWNRLIHGDNLATMAALRVNMAGKIALIYLDPPFFTGEEWHTSPRNTRMPAFSDDWNGDLGAYLQWLYDRLTLARELLAEDGSLYVHLSWHAVHYVKLLLDEIFGTARFQNEIVWCYREAINSRKRWNRKHDTLLFYSKGNRFTFHSEAVREPYADSHLKKYRLRDEQGAYRLMGRGIIGSPLHSRRDLPPDYEARYPGLTYRHYLGEGTLPVDYWLLDIENQASPLRTGYPTQKPEALLERILLASSNPGDLVADFCCGSGTTLAVASRLGRRWIGGDSGALAVHTTRKRLLEQTDCVPFAVERVETSPDQSPMPSAQRSMPKAAEGCPVSPDAIIIAPTERGARLRLAPEAAAWADMWAIEWLDRLPEGEAPFRPHWWAARTRRCPTLAEECPVCAPEGTRTARVALTDVAGRTACLSLALSSG
jgi:site-specific DNA-methyltransferase (adenine-specific)/adenine-specific DNA-methyltransferase